VQLRSEDTVTGSRRLGRTLLPEPRGYLIHRGRRHTDPLVVLVRTVGAVRRQVIAQRERVTASGWISGVFGHANKLDQLS